MESSQAISTALLLTIVNVAIIYLLPLLSGFGNIDPSKLLMVIGPAITLAGLGSIDTLLTSLVNDNLTRTKHNSNRELIGQGIGNMVAAIFGGLPGAGATMPTLVNINAGGKTRISGIIHGIFLLLTVFVNLIEAVGIGMIIASVLFMKRIGGYNRFQSIINEVPPSVDTVIFRMKRVPFMDQTGAYALETIINLLLERKIRGFMTMVQAQPLYMLERIGIVPGLISREYLFADFLRCIEWLEAESN